MSPRTDVEQERKQVNFKKLSPAVKIKGTRQTAKVIDESATRGLVDEEDPIHIQKRYAAQMRYSEQMSKICMLMDKMQKYHPNCSIKFLKQPHRLDLKFERSFSMAIKKNRKEIMARFPKRSIKTVYVSMS